MASTSTAQYSKTQLPNKQTKISSKNQIEDNGNNQGKSKQQVTNDPKKKAQGNQNSSQQKNELKAQQNSNIKNSMLDQSQENQQQPPSPYKMSSATHNNGYYSQKSYRKQRNQEIEDTFIKQNQDMADAIDKSQQDIRLKLTQQVHMADVFQLQPSRDTHNMRYEQDVQNTHQNQSNDYVKQQHETNAQYALDNESNNYYGGNQFIDDQLNSSRQQQNLRPSDTKFEDYLNLRNQVQSPSVHQRLYHQALSQQKQQQIQNHENPHQNIFSVGHRNYSSEKKTPKTRTSSYKKQRPNYLSGSKMQNDDDITFQNQVPQSSHHHESNSSKYFSSSQQFIGDGNDSNMNENNPAQNSHQNVRNSNNSGYRASARSNSKNPRQQQYYQKLNLPQIDQNLNNSINYGQYPHTTTNQLSYRSSLKQPFSRQQSPARQSTGLNTPNSKAPVIQYKRRDSSTRIKELGNSIQERYSDKIEKMKLKYSKNSHTPANSDDTLGSQRYTTPSQQQNGGQNNIQRKGIQNSIQQAAINIEEQRQRIRKHEEERDQELISQNNTYRGGHNRYGLDYSPHYSSTERQKEGEEEEDLHYYNSKDRYREEQEDGHKQHENKNEDIPTTLGNYITKEKIRKLSNYNLKLNSAEEKIQKILTTEDQQTTDKFNFARSNSKQSRLDTFGQDNNIAGLSKGNDNDQTQHGTVSARRNSQQNIAILGNRNQRFVEFDQVNQVKETGIVHQRDILINHRDLHLDAHSNSNSPNTNDNPIPRSESKQNKIKQNYYYQQSPPIQSEFQETHLNSQSQPQTPAQNYVDDDFSRIRTQNETQNRQEQNNNNEDEEEFYRQPKNTENKKISNLDAIYQKKKANIVQRVEDHVRDSLHNKIDTFDNMGDLKTNQPPQNEIINNQNTPFKKYTKANPDINRGTQQRRSGNREDDENTRLDSSNQRYPHSRQHSTLIDTFEGERDNKYNNNPAVVIRQSSIGQDSKFETFDSKLKNNHPTPSSHIYQQRMTFLDKQLSELQQIKEKQKKNYNNHQGGQRYNQHDGEEDEIDGDERFNKQGNHYNKHNAYEREELITPLSYNNESQFIGNKDIHTPRILNEQEELEDEEDFSHRGLSPTEKNQEIKAYNMLKKQPVKNINRNINDLEKIQSNLGNIEKQIQQLNQKYQKYQTNTNPILDKELSDRLFTFQVDERIYNKFKKYLPSDVNQRANQVQKYEQFSSSLQNKNQYQDEKNLEEYLDTQIQTQLQKYLPLDVSQRLQIDSDITPRRNYSGMSDLKDREPEFDDYINKKIQERLLQYLPHDISVRLNSIPKENYNIKKSNQNID